MEENTSHKMFLVCVCVVDVNDSSSIFSVCIGLDQILLAPCNQSFLCGPPFWPSSRAQKKYPLLCMLVASQWISSCKFVPCSISVNFGFQCVFLSPSPLLLFPLSIPRLSLLLLSSSIPSLISPSYLLFCLSLSISPNLLTQLHTWAKLLGILLATG